MPGCGEGAPLGHCFECPMNVYGVPSQSDAGASGSGSRGFLWKSKTCSKLWVFLMRWVR